MLEARLIKNVHITWKTISKGLKFSTEIYVIYMFKTQNTAKWQWNGVWVRGGGGASKKESSDLNDLP